MNRLSLVLPLACVLCACAETYDAGTASETNGLAAQPSTASTANTATLAHFTGDFDAETGEITIGFVDPAMDFGPTEYRAARQALGFCNDLGINGGGGLHAFSMDTVAGSIAATVADCIPPAEVSAWSSLFYASGGAFCATVRVANDSTFFASNVTAEITSISPGYEGYRFQVVPDGAEPCCGTGADLSGLGGQNVPTDLSGGAFSHGDLAPGDQADTQWTFRNAGGSFEFSGRLSASIAEAENGRDDDCDGRIDNNTQTYGDSVACMESGDCVSGLCTDVDVDSGEGICAATCAADTFGESCTPCPSCGPGTCDDGAGGDGSCVCPAGFGGSVCDECVSGFFGPSCDACPDCGSGFCADGLAGAGTCECPEGVHGSTCAFTCSDGVMNGDETDVDSGGSCGSPVSSGSIATGEQFSCALEDGEVLCFGFGGYGSLGRGDTRFVGNAPGTMGTSLIPVGIPEPAVSVMAGRFHACAISDSGSLYCWGLNNVRQLGRADQHIIGTRPSDFPLPPVDVGVGRTVMDVAAGWHHTCALLDDGSVKCWGVNGYGQLGRPRTGPIGQPHEMGDALPTVDLGTGRTAVDIAVGQNHSCAALDDGTVKCWGLCVSGQCGVDVTLQGEHPTRMGDNMLPVALGTGARAIQIASGRDHVCALLDSGDIKCWGANGYGQLGQGDRRARGRLAVLMGDNLAPIAFAPGLTPVSVHAGSESSCAVFDDGSARCWGDGRNGCRMSGDGASIGSAAGQMETLPAMDLGAGREVLEVSRNPSGYQHACARFTDGDVRCWGWGGAGNLGTEANAIYGQHPDRLGDAIPIADLNRHP